MKVAQAKHWKGEAIDKEDKLNRAVKELNESTSKLEHAKKVEKNLRVELEERKHELEQAKCNLETSTYFLKAEIVYNMTMDLFKEEAKKKNLGNFY